MKVWAGLGIRDITPPAGFELSGFAARSGGAIACQDPLTVRALAIDDTVIVIADVIGIDPASASRIAASAENLANVVVIATHTHGGPVSMPGRLGYAHDLNYIATLEENCSIALNRALKNRIPAQLLFGTGTPPGIARNRRSPTGPVDDNLSFLLVEADRNSPMAVLASYSCHPVVLDAHNRHWTGDYPYYLRKALERQLPGAMALFATGCAGDINTGHCALSYSTSQRNARSFTRAREIGSHIASAITETKFTPLLGTILGFERRTVDLAFKATPPSVNEELIKLWQRERLVASSAKALLLDHWLDWAKGAAKARKQTYRVSLSAVRWGNIGFLALPGEIFASTGLSIRNRFDKPLIIAGYADDNPGYIPPREAYLKGGYEVEQAHRYYRMPAAFAPGGAEKIADIGLDALRSLWRDL